MKRMRPAAALPALWRFVRQEAAHAADWWRFARDRWPRWREWLITHRRRNLIIAAAAVAAVTAGYSGWRYYEYRSLFNAYYQYFYSAYLPRADARRAHLAARHYAAYYASYYLSSDYRHSLDFALPEADEAREYKVSRAENRPLRVSGSGIGLIKHFEGFRGEPYRDAGGKLTIGFGHLIRRGELYDRLSEAEAEALLLRDLEAAEAVVKRYVRVPLRQAEFDALASLAFNIGERHFKTSTLLRRLNDDERREAAEEFLRWKHVDGEVLPGLVRRRQQERALFLSAR